MSQNISIGDGSNIGWGTFVGSDVTIGQFVSLNCNICVGHDVMMENYVEVGPCSAVNGFCYIEEGVHIASNCTIAPGVRVGAWSKISANTAVMRDVPPCSFVVGVPGTVHKNFFQYPMLNCVKKENEGGGAYRKNFLFPNTTSQISYSCFTIRFRLNRTPCHFYNYRRVNRSSFVDSRPSRTKNGKKVKCTQPP